LGEIALLGVKLLRFRKKVQGAWEIRKVEHIWRSVVPEKIPRRVEGQGGIKGAHHRPAGGSCARFTFSNWKTFFVALIPWKVRVRVEESVGVGTESIRTNRLG